MAEQDTLKKPKKFFFDQNSFDDDHLDEEEEYIPPPPTFSEEELEASKSIAFEKGRQEGYNEAQASREQRIEAVVDNISGTFDSLFQQEDLRTSVFEKESISLAREIFKKLFPVLNEQNGTEEVIHVIKNVIESHADKPEIIIEVSPDIVDNIQKRIDVAIAKSHNIGTCTVTGNDALQTGDCKMSWKNGGAIRSAEGIAAEILDHINQIGGDKNLADTDTVRDNDSQQDDPVTASQTPPQTEKNDE